MLKGDPHSAWQKTRNSTLDKAPVCTEGATECAIRWRCLCRPSAYNKDRGRGRAASHRLGGEHAAVHWIKAPKCAEDAEESTIRWWGRCGPTTHNEEVTLGNKERSMKCAPWRLAGDVEGRFCPGLAEGTLRALDGTLEDATECAGHRRCWVRPDTHGEEVTLDNKDRGAEHNPTGLIVDGGGGPALA
ncbi:hypothetical protein NDU88_010393 [Pleurodeles waltl]|uniref:Uncharacterized protein n=1 Tax=Pleurodeles waltl TaxID=8319 RepID=A0AAV7QUD2_PLEWA|nr:hypothetical protein NDU88_010393 [Pleurodeles waltl]